MAFHRPRFGLPASIDRDYCVAGRRFQIGSSDMRTLKLLKEIYEACALPGRGRGLFSVRVKIVEARALNSTSLLCLVAERTDDQAVRVLAIWLRGRCGGSLGTASLARFATHPDRQTRKETARALKRMGAWAPLRVMAESDTSERVRRMATSEPPKNYRERLASFSRGIPRIGPASANFPLFVSPELIFGQARPPKPASAIRSVLERIHRLIAGCSLANTRRRRSPPSPRTPQSAS